jgi:5-methylcytosine-specific restriction enzyme A
LAFPECSRKFPSLWPSPTSVLLRVSASFLSKDPDSEGRKRLVLHVSYERSQKNRREAIKRQGTTCAVRTFNFDQTYGYDYADGYIQIHHIKPLSEYEGKVDPETDLVPLCANCHAMAHRRRDTVTSIEELKELIEKAKG